MLSAAAVQAVSAAPCLIAIAAVASSAVWRRFGGDVGCGFGSGFGGGGLGDGFGVGFGGGVGSCLDGGFGGGYGGFRVRWRRFMHMFVQRIRPRCTTVSRPAWLYNGSSFTLRE